MQLPKAALTHANIRNMSDAEVTFSYNLQKKIQKKIYFMMYIVGEMAKILEVPASTLRNFQGYEAIYKRRTVREFLDKEVNFEAIRRILEAGNAAPTWNHNRNGSYIVLRMDEEKEYAFEHAKKGK